ncbi:hypothetical protein BURC_02480 [Burkholderiaceae bacterium]|nr:hypothetical protein BURC_02480 [Burkholderiaceae bacterium]
MRHSSLLPARFLGVLLAGALAVAAAALPRGAQAQSVAVAGESGPAWTELSAAQRASLRPLERDWASIDGDNKQKWIDVARRMPSMGAAERARVQARMSEWTHLSAQQRGQARLGYQEAKQVSPKDRQAQWEAYQALSPEQKRQLQSRAVPPPPYSGRAATAQRNDREQAKSNIVPNPAHAAPPRPVAPSVIQAQPGATTSLISKRPVPPAHQQTGVPKIAATPEFVDKTTLLPRRGPQAAAARSRAASAPAKRP